MAKPKISLLMPVYNSFGFARSNNKELLPLALNSLLRQSYKEFELIILDNQSTDDTSKICRQFAEKDPRIKYVVDTQKRYPEASIGVLGSMADGKYCAIVNDDDLWEKEYLEKFILYMETHPEVDLVYGRKMAIDLNNWIINIATPNISEIYNKEMSRFFCLSRYAYERNVIPIAFGLYKTEVFKKVLPYEDFDSLKYNVDNVFMLKFFLAGFKAQYFKDAFFCYRHKDRSLNTVNYAPNLPGVDKPVSIWFFYVRHQLLFFKKMREMIENKPFQEENNNKFLYAFILMRNIQICIETLRSIRVDAHRQANKDSESKINDLLNKDKELISELLVCPGPDSFIMDNLVSDNALLWWQSKTHNAINKFLKLLNCALSQERNADSLIFYQKAKQILEEELIFYNHLDLKYNRFNDFLVIPEKVSLARIIRFIRNNIIEDYPFLLTTVLFLRKIWLTIRFKSIINYALK